MMKLKYSICDVFTDQRFGGNQLAVLPDARGLNDTQMQQIAREFNFSESTFVFPPEEGHTRKVQIFTPAREVPFAGHPNIGTAFVLASCGEREEFDDSTDIVFEEKAGLVGISICRSDAGMISCELKAPEVLSLGKVLPAGMLADAVSVSASEIVTDRHPPMLASVGLPFVMVELRDQSTLEKARINANGFEQIAARGVIPDIHVYVQSHDEFDIRARMFAPHDGVPGYHSRPVLIEEYNELGGHWKLYINAFSPAECAAFFDALINAIPWQQETIQMYGKRMKTPRLTSWHGDPGRIYRYSGAS